MTASSTATHLSDSRRGLAALTPRQREVHGLILGGRSNKDIARALGISPHTAKEHVVAVLRALGATSRHDLAPRAPGPAQHPDGESIEARACALLSPELGECVRQRTALGVAKYGQRLDDNRQPTRARAVHLVQELLDATQYALWLGEPALAARSAAEATVITRRYGLSVEDIMAGGKA